MYLCNISQITFLHDHFISIELFDDGGDLLVLFVPQHLEYQTAMFGQFTNLA